MKIALGIEYNGAAFCGWQKQMGLSTLQGKLEEALTKVAAHPVEVFCAGRTDAGVHATGQVVHFVAPTPRELKAWVLGTNSYLPNTMRVTWAHEVDEEFHARFSAHARRYVYVIYNQPIRPALYRHLITWEFRPLDATRMHIAAQHLLGELDFTSFRSTACQSLTPFRFVEYIKVSRVGDLVLIDIKANAFLHHMVRNIAGVLMEVGFGVREPDWVQEVLIKRDRSVAARTAFPDGLYLVAVDYEKKFALPNKVQLPFWLNDRDL